MAKRKTLKGIAHGLLGTFVSRNNDIGGYWGLGVLRQFANRISVRSLELDLLRSSGDHPVLQEVETRYRNRLLDALGSARIAPTEIEGAKIGIFFADEIDFPDAVHSTRGKPYKCTVTLTRRDGIAVSAERIGYCDAHDPSRESRSMIG